MWGKGPLFYRKHPETPHFISCLRACSLYFLAYSGALSLLSARCFATRYMHGPTKGACILLSIDISFPRGAQQQTRRTQLLLSNDGRRTDGQTFDRFIDLTPHTVRAVSLMSTPIQTVIVVYLLCFISGGCFEKEMNSCTDTHLIVAVSYWFFSWIGCYYLLYAATCGQNVAVKAIARSKMLSFY